MKCWALVSNMKHNRGHIAWCLGHMRLADILRYKINDELDNGEFAMVEISGVTDDDIKSYNNHEYVYDKADSFRDVNPSIVPATKTDLKIAVSKSEVV